uniref:Secreted protein n=1 Tax=Echinococcus granulosus TaxID=6210 RepID=U6FR50_ECHGR|nr:hypothetical protein EgrG_002061200 [Echinococcus granulosus]
MSMSLSFLRSPEAEMWWKTKDLSSLSTVIVLVYSLTQRHCPAGVGLHYDSFTVVNLLIAPTPPFGSCFDTWLIDSKDRITGRNVPNDFRIWETVKLDEHKASTRPTPTLSQKAEKPMKCKHIRLKNGSHATRTEFTLQANHYHAFSQLSITL